MCRGLLIDIGAKYQLIPLVDACQYAKSGYNDWGSALQLAADVNRRHFPPQQRRLSPYQSALLLLEAFSDRQE